ncbi:MAG: hypothetical protein Fur0042_28880 [Cyanophyceae cyanobacterium]
MILVLLLAVPLVAWSLHLMQQAFDHREFSLMLAGALVASSAAALVVVYFLMSSSLGYLMGLDRRGYVSYYGAELPMVASDPIAIAQQFGSEDFPWLIEEEAAD